MKWFDKDEKLLLERAFLFGAVGIVLGFISLANLNFRFLEAPMGPLNGVSLGLQLFGMSIAVLVLRKRKITDQTKDKAKKMVLVLGVSLMFFFLIL